MDLPMFSMRDQSLAPPYNSAKTYSNAPNVARITVSFITTHCVEHRSHPKSTRRSVASLVCDPLYIEAVTDRLRPRVDLKDTNFLHPALM